MRTYDELIYLGDMPGASEPLDRWFSQLQDGGIERVFCLATEDERQEKSPDYAAWQRNGDASADRVHVLDVSLPADLSDFESDQVVLNRFWEHAFLAAYVVAEGKPIFVHSANGDGRAEMFAAAVLIVSGHEPDDAIERICRSGAGLDSDDQRAFLRAGIPRPIMETMPPDPKPESAGDSIDVGSPEAQGRFQREAENPNSIKNRSIYGPNDDFRNLWQDRSRLTESDAALKQNGLRMIADPMSRAWLETTHQEKVGAFCAAMSVLLGKQTDQPDPFFCSVVIQARLHLALSQAVPISDDAFAIAGTCFVQAALDPDYSIPSSKEETDALISRFSELKDGRKRRRVEGNFDRHGLGKLPLGREELDANSAEGKSTSIDQKIQRIRAVLRSGLPLLDAVALYRYRYGGSGYVHVLRDLPSNLFALAAYGFRLRQ